MGKGSNIAIATGKGEFLLIAAKAIEPIGHFSVTSTIVLAGNACQNGKERVIIRPIPREETQK